MAVGTVAEHRALLHSAPVELFAIDANPITQSETPPQQVPILRYYNGTDFAGEPPAFRGDLYLPNSISGEGWSIVTEGTLPRPTLSIGDVDGAISGILRSYRNLVGALVTRIVTFEPYLDGHEHADPLKVREERVWQVNQLLPSSDFQVDLELKLKSDLQGETFPRHIVGEFCGVRYRGTDCTWAGFNMDVNDVKEGEPGYNGIDFCAKRLISCKRRFQDADPAAHLPTHGFPGASRPIQ